MHRFLGVFCALVSIPVARATVLYTDSTESGGVLQFSTTVVLGTTVTNSEYSSDTGFAFVLPSGTYDDIGFDLPLEQDGSGTNDGVDLQQLEQRSSR